MKRIVIFGSLLLLLGGIGGIALSMFSLKEVIYYDFDSGREKREIKMGPVVMRTQEYFNTVFEAYPVGNSLEYSLTGNERWEIIDTFHGFSMRSSYSSVGGMVYGLSRRLASMFPVLGWRRSAELKKEFLEILSENDLSTLDQLVLDVEDKFVEKDYIGAAYQQWEEGE